MQYWKWRGYFKLRERTLCKGERKWRILMRVNGRIQEMEQWSENNQVSEGRKANHNNFSSEPFKKGLGFWDGSDEKMKRMRLGLDIVLLAFLPSIHCSKLSSSPDWLRLPYLYIHKSRVPTSGFKSLHIGSLIITWIVPLII